MTHSGTPNSGSGKIVPLLSPATQGSSIPTCKGGTPFGITLVGRSMKGCEATGGTLAMTPFGPPRCCHEQPMHDALDAASWRAVEACSCFPPLRETGRATRPQLMTRAKKTNKRALVGAQAASDVYTVSTDDCQATQNQINRHLIYAQASGANCVGLFWMKQFFDTVRFDFVLSEFTLAPKSGQLGRPSLIYSIEPVRKNRTWNGNNKSGRADRAQYQTESDKENRDPNRNGCAHHYCIRE